MMLVPGSPTEAEDDLTHKLDVDSNLLYVVAVFENKLESEADCFVLPSPVAVYALDKAMGQLGAFGRAVACDGLEPGTPLAAIDCTVHAVPGAGPKLDQRAMLG
jgi:hypothetical protein